jgi:hypothetical protein
MWSASRARSWRALSRYTGDSEANLRQNSLSWGFIKTLYKCEADSFHERQARSAFHVMHALCASHNGVALMSIQWLPTKLWRIYDAMASNHTMSHCCCASSYSQVLLIHIKCNKTKNWISVWRKYFLNVLFVFGLSLVWFWKRSSTMLTKHCFVTVQVV